MNGRLLGRLILLTAIALVLSVATLGARDVRLAGVALSIAQDADTVDVPEGVVDVLRGDLPGESDEADMITISLDEAIQRAWRLDPSYIAAERQVANAAWERRSAATTFFTPTLDFQSTATRFSTEIFNVGTNELTTQIVDARLEASYDVFRGGGKFHDLKRANANLAASRAGVEGARYNTALDAEADYYDVLAQRELTTVAEERAQRAADQLAVARARVVSGAAVQSDSLQLLLELTRARVDVLTQRAQLRVARIQLGRRTGHPGPVDAVPILDLPPALLPLDEQAAIDEAVASSPRAVAARADAEAFDAALRAAKSEYLPRISLFGQVTSFDDSFFPNATTRSLFGIQVSLPLWNYGLREIQVTRARSDQEVAQATSDDTERELRRDVVRAYQAYYTARASYQLAEQAVVVARENLRVQEQRYRAGATNILDLITAQNSLSDAEAGAVQARYATWLALADMEAILGRRLYEDR